MGMGWKELGPAMFAILGLMIYTYVPVTMMKGASPLIRYIAVVVPYTGTMILMGFYYFYWIGRKRGMKNG